jgi:hypothetical protein
VIGTAELADDPVEPVGVDVGEDEPEAVAGQALRWRRR